MGIISKVTGYGAMVRESDGAQAVRQAVAGSKSSSIRLRKLAVLAASVAMAAGQVPAVMASPPTIGAATASTSIATGTSWSFEPASSHAAKYTFVGGDWGPTGVSFPADQIWKGIVSRVGNGTDPTLNPVYGGRVRFSTESPLFEIWVQCAASGSGDGFRLKIDGQYAKLGVLANDGNGLLRYILITHGTGVAADRKVRHYELEFGNSGAFLGIRTENIYKPSPWPQADSLKVLMHGDSFVWTVVDSGNKDLGLAGAMGNAVANVLGQFNYIGSGVGGSGWMTPVAKDRSYFNDRVTLDVVARAPDIIIEHGGGNDVAAAPTQAAIQALIEAWLSAVLTANPGALIFMTSPLIASEPGASHLTIAAAKQAAAAKWPKNVAYIDTFTDKWTFGTGRQGATASNGNRDWVCGNDAAHPTIEGHRYLAGRIARGVAAAIPALIAANS